MELDEAIKILKEDLEHTKKANECGLATKGEFNKEIEAIEFILNHITKQDKMIELMAYEIDRLDDGSVTYGGHENFIENIKQYFEKRVEESE